MRGGIEIIEIGRNVALRQRVFEAAALDAHGHMGAMATHAFVRGQSEIVGASAICVPLLVFWAHSEKLKALQTVPLIHQTRRTADKVAPFHLCECAAGSPIHKLMPKIGYRVLGGADFFTRETI